MPGSAPPDPRFRLNAGQANSLAERFGTPLYVIDEGHFRRRIRRYLAAFSATWPNSELAYAAKANSTLAVLAIANQEGCGIDVASEGELRAAMGAGIPASRCTLHGNNKSKGELEFAIISGVGQIVADNLQELELLSLLLPAANPTTKVVLRLAPGVDPITHHKISTGQADTKFGFNIGNGAAERAALRCMELKLPLVGFHCHVGSQLLDCEAQRSGAEMIAQFAAEVKARHGFAAEYLNAGGGLGVTYISSDKPVEVEKYCAAICDAVRVGLTGSGLNPKLGQEPGRALIAESGVTLYRVGAVKTVPSPTRGVRTYVSVDGGLSDNPRPALYGARYEVEVLLPASQGRPSVGRPAGAWARPSARKSESAESAGWISGQGRQSVTQGGSGVNTTAGDRNGFLATVSGRHCETDTLFEDVTLPMATSPGDLMQVLCTGAYNSSMASNYNRYPRPATILIRETGEFVLAQSRDSWEEMFARENVPADLLK